jgi:hypothetical protein
LVEECAKIVTKPVEGEAPKEVEELKQVDVENLKTVQGVPDFWYRSIKNNQMIFELVKEKDEEVLKHLNNVESERQDSPKALTVRFHFNKNEFFTNDVLSLKVYYKGD